MFVCFCFALPCVVASSTASPAVLLLGSLMEHTWMSCSRVSLGPSLVCRLVSRRVLGWDGRRAWIVYCCHMPLVLTQLLLLYGSAAGVGHLLETYGCCRQELVVQCGGMRKTGSTFWWSAVQRHVRMPGPFGQTPFAPITAHYITLCSLPLHCCYCFWFLSCCEVLQCMVFRLQQHLESSPDTRCMHVFASLSVLFLLAYTNRIVAVETKVESTTEAVTAAAATTESNATAAATATVAAGELVFHTPCVFFAGFQPAVRPTCQSI